MALYRQGKAAMDANGIVTGTGTNWQSALTLIRPGATILFLSSPIQMAVVNKVVSDTQINAITTNGAVVPSSDYAILLSDSLTVDGLAQDVAETLRYYQSQETVIADAVEFFKGFDFESLQNLANQIKADSEAADSSASAAAESEGAAKTSENNAKASELAAETARDQVQQIINDAGEQSTLVVLAQPDGAEKSGYKANTSAIARTVQSALSDFVNLHDYYTTADNGNWKPAFDRAFLVSLNVLVPFGVHTVNSSVSLPSGSKVIGFGDSSIVKSAAADDAAGTKIVTVFTANAKDDITIRNLLVDGGVTEVNTTKNYTRTIRFINCTNVKLINVTARNNADWTTSFEGGKGFVVLNYVQRSYVYTNTSVNLNGGRDGLHFMDCSDVYADGLDIESGDDCVGITTTGTDMENITIKGLRGKSNIASLVIYNEEQDSSGNYYSNTLTNLTIDDIAVKAGGLARNIVRVIGYGASTVIEGLNITNIRGKANNSYGLWVQNAREIYLNGIDVSSSQAHGIYLNNVERVAGSAAGKYLGDNASASFAGVNINAMKNSLFTPISRDSYGFGVQIAASSDCIFTPSSTNNGAGLRATNGGGNLRVVNCVGVSIPSGIAKGPGTTSYFGINQTGNTDLYVGLGFEYGGFTNSALPAEYYLQSPVVDVKVKEDSAGTVINHVLVGATIVRNSTGNFTITFSKTMTTTNFSWSATAYRNGALVFVRLASAVGTNSITIQVVDASNVPTYADHIEFKAFGATV